MDYKARKKSSSGQPQRSRSASSKRTATPPRRKSSLASVNTASTSSTPMDKTSMLVMEANEISTYLQKDYTFSKLSEGGEEGEARIKVKNRALRIACTWSLSKLKERLMRMRKLMYADESETLGIDGESVFFDPNDTWTKEDDDDDATPVPVHISSDTDADADTDFGTRTSTGTGMPSVMQLELKPGVVHVTKKPSKPPKPVWNSGDEKHTTRKM